MTVVQVQSSGQDDFSGTELTMSVQLFRYGTQNVRTVVYVERDKPPASQGSGVGSIGKVSGSGTEFSRPDLEISLFYIST
jgi:hypothetical protein